jgi:TctA family transporter
VLTEQPALFRGIIASMWIGNFFLIVLNLPMIGLWVRMIGIPYHFLFPAILVFCAIGAFSLSNSTFDVFLLAAFGVVGYVLRKLDCEPAPLLLGFILGPMMEENLRRALMINRGDASVLFTRPISCALLVGAIALLVMVLLPSIRARRDVAFQEE